LPVFALQATCSCDVDCGEQGLGDEMAGLAVVGCIPVLGLVLDLQ